MLNQEMLNKLRHMKMTGIAEALEQQEQDPGYEELSFQERLNLLVDWEYSKRQHNRLQLLISQAKFQNPDACVEDINYAIDRKLDRNLILELASCNYIPHGQNIVIVGATGAGKSYIAQALGQAACRRLISTKYIQLPDLLEELRIAKDKGPDVFTRLRKQYVKCGLLIIDEWLLFPICIEDTENLLSIIDRRKNLRPTIVVSQLEPAEWLDQIPVHLAAESITDRVSTKAHRITIKGTKSMRSI
ncbi:ATP-binding protein [Youngiibacter multivorans]|uniref:DNA replication protein DnaC n=1 Tax=Youngiibacter multivorans TaxID=937251 RepID=A0ABS4G382_9CLOT|nr:ATP-binding protein [Youngiibacter multivorans]MBP1919002.1 DNA replication protein DnaC [Youngiibacter multivorans]